MILSNVNINNENALQYTDYKKAHVTQTKLINAKKVKTRQYQNVKELETVRSNISYEMNDTGSNYYKDKRKEKTTKVRRRRRRLFQRDQSVQEQYHKINQLTERN